jgi:thiamine biosynthesis lipoprotein
MRGVSVRRGSARGISIGGTSIGGTSAGGVSGGSGSSSGGSGGDGSGGDGSDSKRVSTQRFEFHEAHMGTDARIVVYAGDERAAGVAARAAFDRVEALNGTLSDYQSTSELMMLSARAGQGPVAISDDLFRVLQAAQDLAARSDGAFDVTCGPLTRLWRRARHVSELPATARVDEARALTSFRWLQLDASARTATLTTPGMSLDVGGIAKGYAAEEALRVLVSRGLPRALVALGGDIALADPPPDREGWLIDVATLDVVARPDSNTRADGVARRDDVTRRNDDARPSPAVGPILLRRAAVSTAGDAEQWLTVNDVRYSHILDPRTGRPMTVRSTTTVIAPHGLDADGLDTTAAILGVDRGLALVEATPGAAVFMMRLEPDGHTTVRTSSRWPPRASDTRPSADPKETKSETPR